MKKRLLALLLALVMVVGVMAGCSKKGTSDTPGTSASEPGSKPSADKLSQPEKATVTAKYAYKAEFKDITAQFEWINQICAAGNSVYLSASVQGEEITETDEVTGETYTYNDYRDGLFRLDMETGEVTELENFVMPEIPEGWQGGTNVYHMQAAPDGTLWMLVNFYTYRYNVPEDFDPATDQEYNYYEQGEEKSSLLHVAADGSLIAELNIQPERSEEQQYYNSISTFCVDTAGNVYAGDWQYVYVFDATGKQLFMLDCSENGGSLCQMNSDTVGIATYVYDEATQTGGQRFLPIDLATQDFGEAIKLPQNAYNFFPGDDVYDLYFDNNGNIFGYDLETQTQEKVVDWIECDINSNDMNGYAILPDGRVVAFLRHWDSAAGESTTQMVTLTRVDASSLPEKTAITLACMWLDWDLREKIVDFNKTSEQYRIVVKDYSEYNTEDDYTAGMTKLNTEILSGKVPDLFLLNDQMPVDLYAGKGVIADLYQFIDNDETLSRESFVQPLLRALEKDGKLYEMPTSFYIQTAFGLNKVVGDYETWTLADLKDAMTKLQPDATVFNVYNTKSDMLQQCIARNIGAFVDWTTATVSFDSPEFIALLEFANSFPAEFDWENYNWQEDDNTQARLNSGKQLLSLVSFSTFEDYLYQCYGYDSGIRFVGYPSEDGTSNNSFYTQTGFAISAVSACQDAAWAFVREQLLGQKQQVENQSIWCFPVMQDAFDRMLEKAMTPEYQYDENGEIMYDENGEPLKWPKMTYGGGVSIAPDGTETQMESVEIYELSQADADVILDLIENTHSVYSYDQDIMNIITDEVAAFFAGEKSAEDTAAMVQSRVNLYVQEQS